MCIYVSFFLKGTLMDEYVGTFQVSQKRLNQHVFSDVIWREITKFI